MPNYSTIANYPNGFPYGVTMRNMSILNYHSTSRVFWVDSNNGADAGKGTFVKPFKSLQFAINQTVQNRGDRIMLKAGHAETLTAAGAITVTSTQGGFTVEGLGVGNERPTFTFSTAAGASILIQGAGFSMRNVIGVSGINSLTQPFDIRAANCSLDFEWQDTGSFEAVRAALTTSAASMLYIRMRYRGLTGGSLCVNAVRLVGVAECWIDMDFYGKASTAVVEFATTACTGVRVVGNFYNNANAAGTLNVVDTITGSVWWADIYDASLGNKMDGGSARALAAADTAVIGTKADAAVYVPGTTASLFAYQKGEADLQERVLLKTAALLTTGMTIFTVTGGPICILNLFLLCSVGGDATAATVQFSVTPTQGSAQTISGASGSIANAAAGASVALQGTALATAAVYNANGPNIMANRGTILCPAGTITLTIGSGPTVTGTWVPYIRYAPLATGVTVT